MDLQLRGAEEALSFWQQLGTSGGRSSLWRKYRKPILIGAGVVGVGAIGVGSYWYWCYWNEWCEREEVFKLQREAEARKRREELERQQQLEEAARADAQLQTHFESIQMIADSTTLPSVLPHLKTKLFALIDLSSLTEALVASRGSAGRGLSTQQKMRIWEDLKVLSFSRALGSMWATALLFLFVRIQLNILGRHVYINTAADNPAAAQGFGSGGEQGKPQLSMSCQHKFIAFSDYLPHCGLAVLLKDVQDAMAKALHLRSLKDKFNLDQLQTLLHDLRAEFEFSHSSRWHKYLLPETNVLPDDLAVASSAADVAQAGTSLVAQEQVEEPDDHDHAVSTRGKAMASAMAGGFHRASQEAMAEMEGGAEAGVRGEGRASVQGGGQDGEQGRPKEDAALDDLMTETRRVLNSRPFKDALKMAVDSLSRVAIGELATTAFSGAAQVSQLAGNQSSVAPVALAKLLPPVAAVAASLLELDDNKYLQQLSMMPELTSFSAMVYAGSLNGA